MNALSPLSQVHSPAELRLPDRYWRARSHSSSAMEYESNLIRSWYRGDGEGPRVCSHPPSDVSPVPIVTIR